jgi:hypothetical protein
MIPNLVGKAEGKITIDKAKSVMMMMMMKKKK